MPRIAVAGPNQLVTDAAGLIADIGGSVVDTAIVAALAAMCSEPGICAPGGGGFLTINLPGACLLYTSDAADDLLLVCLGGLLCV